MRVIAKIEGVDPPAWLRERSRLAARAVTVGVHAAMGGAHQDLRAMVRSVGMGVRLGNAIRLKLYPKPPAYSPRAAAEIVAMRNAADIIETFSEGATISGKGRMLAIPTQAVPRDRWNAKLSPREVELRFLRKLEYRVLDGKPALVLVEARTTKRLGRARAASQRMIRRGKDREVVMFWLKNSVTMPKRLTPRPILAAWAQRLPGIIDRAAAGLRG